MDLYEKDPTGWASVFKSMGTYDIDTLDVVCRLPKVELDYSIFLIGVGTCVVEELFIEQMYQIAIPKKVYVNDLCSDFVNKAYIKIGSRFPYLDQELRVGRLEGQNTLCEEPVIFTMFGNLFGSCSDDVGLITSLTAKKGDQLLLTFPVWIVDSPEFDPLLSTPDLPEYKEWAKNSFGDKPPTFALTLSVIPYSYCVGLMVGNDTVFKFRRYNISALRDWFITIGWNMKMVLQYGPKMGRAVALLEKI